MDITSLAMSDTIRIILAMLAGGLIGLEREFRDKSAGFRTLIFISTGSALLTILSYDIGGPDDSTRIAANIVTGIGFLGAGAILRDGMRVAGLTTAATIWLTAAIGMAFGAGEFFIGGIVTLLTLVVLWLFPSLEHAVDRIREERVYEASVKGGMESLEAIEAALKKTGLKIVAHQHFKEVEGLRCRWITVGKLQSHNQLIQQLMDDPNILEFKY